MPPSCLGGQEYACDTEHLDTNWWWALVWCPGSWSETTNTENPGSDWLVSVVEKPWHPRNSTDWLWTVEQRGWLAVDAYSWTRREGWFMVCCCIKEAGLATLEGAVSVGQQSSGYKYLVAGRRKKSMVDILCTHHTHPPSDPWRRPYHFSEIHHKKRSGEGFAVLSWVWAYPTFLAPAMPMSIMQTHSGSHNQSFLYSLRHTQDHK